MLTSSRRPFIVSPAAPHRAAGLSNPSSGRASAKPNPGAFFVPGWSFHGGLRGETFGSAGLPTPGLRTPRKAASLFRNRAAVISTATVGTHHA